MVKPPCINFSIREPNQGSYNTADKLSGGHPKISLIWLNPTAVEAPEDVPGDADVQLNDVINTPEEVLEPKHEVLADYLTKDFGPSADDDADDDTPMITAELIWELPKVFLLIFFLFSMLTNCVRTGHWVLCIVHLSRRELRLFDSLGEQRPWKVDVLVYTWLYEMTLTEQATEHYDAYYPIAEHGEKELSQCSVGLPPMGCPSNNCMFFCCSVSVVRADSLQIKCVQTNSYDCGIWILVSVASVLRGFDATGLQEEDMPIFRHYIYKLVCSLFLLSNTMDFRLDISCQLLLMYS